MASVAVRERFWDLGAGSNPRPDWLSLDLLPPADIVHDLREPLPRDFEGWVSQAMFYHGPEHYTRAEIPGVLAHIAWLLEPNGILEIRCPDALLWAKQMVREGTVRTGHGALWGEQSGVGQFHYNGFDFAYLSELLLAAGFAGVRRLSAAGEAPLYPYDWSHPELGGDPAKRLDLWVSCRKP